MMRQALRAKAPNRQQVAIPASIPAPVRGWNAQAPLASMKPDDAVIMDNWIPRAGYVEIRRGSVAWASGLSDPTESLMVYRGDPSGGDQLFAVSGGDIYDATAEGAVGSPVKSGLTSNRLQYTNFANDGGAWISAVNGEDDPLLYDGTTWTNPTITGSSGSLTLVPATLVDVMVHKRRLMYAEKDSLRVWYLDLNAIQGTASLLDLGPVFQMGGALACMGTWSLDGGAGQDDFAVYMTTEGEVAIYQGTDPSDANYWSLVGVFAVGKPIGRRALFKFGGDLLIVTTNGVLPLSQALRFERAQENQVAITARIQDAWAEATANYSGLFGWQGIAYQQGQLAIYNVPTSELSTSVQFVQNLQTGAWCRFTGLDAFCWEVTDTAIFFGGADAVYRWDRGITDAGADLVCDLKSAFNYFGRRGTQKQFTMLRPIINATSDVQPAIEMLTNFEERDPVAVPTTTIMGVSGLAIRQDWASVQGVGYCGAVRAQVKVAADPDLVGILAVGDGNLIITEAGGDNIATATPESLNDSRIQIISFDVMFQQGGQL